MPPSQFHLAPAILSFCPRIVSDGEPSLQPNHARLSQAGGMHCREFDNGGLWCIIYFRLDDEPVIESCGLSVSKDDLAFIRTCHE